MVDETGIPDSRTAKVIQLYATPNPASREQVRRRHPSQRSVPPSVSLHGGRGHRSSAAPTAGHDEQCSEDVQCSHATSPAAVTPISRDTDLPQHVARRGSPSGLDALRGKISDTLSSTATFLRERLTGDYEVDDFGFDPHFTDNMWIPALRILFDKWFHVRVTGVENLPDERGALLVVNHAGTIPIDALMTAVAVHDHHPLHRHLRILAADLAFGTPLVSEISRSLGATLACSDDATRLLEAGELTAVWPEGYKGLGKPYRDRYKLQRFGRGGFVTTALRAGAPIIPVSIVGSEEIYPMITDLKPLARVLGLPYFPVTPTFPWLGPLGAVPLPSRWHIHFGRPIETSQFDEQSADDPMVIFDLTDQVREEIQQTLYRMLSRRDRAWF